MGLWFWLYQFHPGGLPQHRLPAVLWHGHEMIYGYAMAVVAGFLLTAVRNWTGVQTLHGRPLLLLAGLWLAARVMPWLPFTWALPAMAVFDLGFALWLCIALLKPIRRARQWSQLGVWVKVVLLGLSNALFYLGLFGVLPEGMRWSLYSGLYLVLSLVLLMGRRVIPFFIEKGVGYPVELINRGWVDMGSLVVMLAFWLVATFSTWHLVAAVLATLLFALHALRLAGWHTPGIWRVRLLWVLYLGYGWVVAGFALSALGFLGLLNPLLAVHAFAVGGIGLLTLGMMARISLGHTGRNVFDPPKVLTPIFFVLVAAAAARVLLPILVPQIYGVWVGIAQVLWIAAFGGFAFLYSPIFIRPRVDGRYG